MKKLNPKYKIGNVVLIKVNDEIYQGIIKYAYFYFRKWHYDINSSAGTDCFLESEIIKKI